MEIKQLVESLKVEHAGVDSKIIRQIILGTLKSLRDELATAEDGQIKTPLGTFTISTIQHKKTGANVRRVNLRVAKDRDSASVGKPAQAASPEQG